MSGICNVLRFESTKSGQLRYGDNPTKNKLAKTAENIHVPFFSRSRTTIILSRNKAPNMHTSNALKHIFQDARFRQSKVKLDSDWSTKMPKALKIPFTCGHV